MVFLLLHEPNRDDQLAGDPVRRVGRQMGERPTTTPGVMRPSTMDSPRAPALKLTNPSCVTVAPGDRCAPSRTRSASAMRTPSGDDVVCYARERVDAGKLQGVRLVLQSRAQGLNAPGKHRTGRRPGDVVQQAVGAVQVQRVRLERQFGLQVQPQVRLLGRRRRDLRRWNSVGDEIALDQPERLGQAAARDALFVPRR